MAEQKCTLDVMEAAGKKRKILLGGILNFETILVLNQRASNLFSNFSEIIIDLSGVTYVNSAGLALLLEWKRKLDLDGKVFQLENVPQKLVNLARMSELEIILFQ